MKAIILQHEQSTPPGSTTEWLKSRQIPFEVVDVSKSQNFPAHQSFELLFICGGSMNVDEEAQHPWLRAEKEFIRLAIEQKKLTVGLCLGGQLISEVLGGTVTKQPQHEVGWHSVQVLKGQNLKVFQWHGYGFSIPPGAQLTASNSNHTNQAFSYEAHVLGFQFHPETTKEWALKCAESPRLPKEGFVQSPEEIKRGIEYQPALQQWYFYQLDFLKQSKE